jgi:hypothetical protein
MAIFNLATLTSMILLLCMIPQTSAQALVPNPTFDCTNYVFQVIYTACTEDDFSKCCPVASSCCAGGCCDVYSSCLNVGTADEVCCPVDSEDACGYYQPGTGTQPPWAVQSVICEGSDGLSSFYCPPKSTCTLHGCSIKNNETEAT